MERDLSRMDDATAIVSTNGIRSCLNRIRYMTSLSVRLSKTDGKLRTQEKDIIELVLRYVCIFV